MIGTENLLEDRQRSGGGLGRLIRASGLQQQPCQIQLERGCFRMTCAQTAPADIHRAIKQRDGYLIWLAIDRRFDKFRSDPRYGALLARVGLPVPSTGSAVARPETRGN